MIKYEDEVLYSTTAQTRRCSSPSTIQEYMLWIARMIDESLVKRGEAIKGFSESLPLKGVSTMKGDKATRCLLFKGEKEKIKHDNFKRSLVCSASTLKGEDEKNKRTA